MWLCVLANNQEDALDQKAMVLKLEPATSPLRRVEEEGGDAC